MVEYRTSICLDAKVRQEVNSIHTYKGNRPPEKSLAQPKLIVLLVIVAGATTIGMREYPWLDQFFMYLAVFSIGFFLGIVAWVLYCARTTKTILSKQQPIELQYVFREHEFVVAQTNCTSVYTWKAIKDVLQSDKLFLMKLADDENTYFALDCTTISQEMKDFITRKVKSSQEA